MRLLLEIKQGIFVKVLLGAWMVLFASVAIAQERVMLITDPHVLASSLVEQGTAMDEMMAGQRKMLDMSEEVFVALIDTALVHKPALVLIPGDLTKDGEVTSHNVVVEQLERLQAAGINVLVIPGNHDIGGKAYAYQGSEKVAVDVLADTEWESQYAWVYEQAIAKDPKSHSYVAEPLRGVTVLGIDASHNAGEGYLSDETLAWVLQQADDARAKGNMILAMCHWQVLEHVDGGGLNADISVRLQNADAVRDQLMAHGVRTLLTGHVHVNSISTYRDTLQMSGDSIMEISTGSPITYPCPYRWLTLSQDRSTVTVETDYLTALPGHADLTDYSHEWMREHAHVMVPALSVRLYDQAMGVIEDYIVKNVPMGSMVFQMLTKTLPQTDEEKTKLVEKHLATTIVELYLLHSEANEPEHAHADSLAQALYNGVGNMIHEVTDATLQKYASIQQAMIDMVNETMQPSVQSLVEDRTHWASPYSDHTDDLTGRWVINEPLPETPVENVTDSEEDGAIYDLLGRRVAETHYRGVYIQNGKKFIK